MQQFSLNDYLAQQQNEGELDSDGEFTISASEGARKLARFALPETYSWVLKVLQAVVGWRAPKLSVRQSRESTSFYFSPADSADYPSQAQIFEALLSVETGGVEPLQRLAIALRSLVEQGGLSFVLGVHGDAQEQFSVYAGHDVSRLEPAVRESWGETSGFGLRLTVSHQKLGEHFVGRWAPGFMLQVRRDLDIAAVLEKTGVCLPLSMELDGRCLGDVWCHPDLGFSSQHRPLLISGNQTEPPGHPKLSMPALGRYRISLFQGPLGLSGQSKVPGNFSSWFVLRGSELRLRYPMVGVERITKGPELRNNSEPPHLVCWVCDGVIVSTQELKPRATTWVAQLILFVNGEGLKTDLTGLKIVESTERTERLKKAFEKTALQLTEELDLLPRYVTEQADANKKTLREENRASTIKQLPKALGPFRKVVAAGTTGPYEWRQAARLKIWEEMMEVDLKSIAAALQNAET